MEVDEQDREQVDNERESRGARGRGRRQNKTNAQTCDIMDDMQMERMRTKHTLSHNVMCAQGGSVRETLSCEVYLSTQQKNEGLRQFQEQIYFHSVSTI